MQRRSFLAASVGAVGSLAGCSGILGSSDGSSDTSSPADVSRALVQALIDGDVAAANDLLHPDSPDGEVEQSNAESFQSVDASIEDVAVASQEGSTATVNVVISAETEDGESGTVTFPFEVRKHDGDWLVYEDLRATGSPPRAPSVQWESTERTDADGSVTAVTFTHGGGDTIQSGSLSARVGESTAPAPEGTDVTAGTTLVVPTEGRGNSMTSSTTVYLTWSDPDGDQSQDLGAHTLSSPTVGTLGETLWFDS